MAVGPFENRFSDRLAKALGYENVIDVDLHIHTGSTIQATIRVHLTDEQVKNLEAIGAIEVE